MFLMKSDVNFKMMQSAPTTLMPLSSTKPKIGFSIDSIVGNRLPKPPNNFSPNSDDSHCSFEGHHSPCSDEQHNRSVTFKKITQFDNMLNTINKTNQFGYMTVNRRDLNQSESLVSYVQPEQCQRNTISSDTIKAISDRKESNSLSTGKKLDESTRSRSPSPVAPVNRPILVPGIPANLVRSIAPNELKPVSPYINTPELVATHPNPHFLAAQFQMANALAHGQINQGFIPSHSIHPRDGYPLYPWLLNRHNRIFPHRFPGNFLLQPFRKPKRVRTAFSPSQLLKLEHAFEGNHYVVGAERKTLAQTLCLSETQVKVWFQNRRTKHKRMQQEEDVKGGNGNRSKFASSLTDNITNNSNFDGSHMSYDDEEDDDELIDMEMDDDECHSDEGINKTLMHHYRTH